MPQSDREWAEEYGRGGQPKPAFKMPKKPKVKEDDELKMDKFYKQRRSQDAGGYSRPRLGGMTVGED